jgi:hypothetical protein
VSQEEEWQIKEEGREIKMRARRVLGRGQGGKEHSAAEDGASCHARGDAAIHEMRIFVSASASASASADMQTAPREAGRFDLQRYPAC